MLKWKLSSCELQPKVTQSFSSSQVKALEADMIMKNIAPSSTVICCDEGGSQMTSKNFANFISEKTKNGISTFTFIVGGAHGLDQKILSHSCLNLSFGLMTMPHLMARCVLIEQIYRACTILENHPYHKE